MPHPKQVIYGERALDFVFGLEADDFDMASFFHEDPPIRITTLCSPEMIQAQLVKLFGESSHFTLEVCERMKEIMLEDLHSNR